MKIFDLIKRLFKKKEKIVVCPTAIKPDRPRPQPVYHMPESKVYKQRNHYSKRMWNNNKPLPKNFKDEDEDV